MLDRAARLRDFPTLATMTYLNTAAEGIPPPSVGEAFGRYVRDKQMGMDGRIAHFTEWNSAKALTGEFYGLSADEIGICSCSSEAYNLAAMALRLRDHDEIIINDLDFPAGATPWLQDTCPAKVKLWRAREGVLRVEDLAQLLTPRSRLVAVSLVSFYNGYLIPLSSVIEVLRRDSPALLALDVTQALGRIPLGLAGVDLIISSTHKWLLASHGGCLVGVPSARAQDWNVPAGGWFNLQDPFGPGRFERAVSHPGAAGFTVGMPNFPAVYAIRAALDYISQVGVNAIDEFARPLVRTCIDGLARLPVELLTPRNSEALAGIVAFRHPKSEPLATRLRAQNIHVMSHAGRLRVAIHGYNTMSDIETFLVALETALHAES
jgi:cysteine desulfurase / selenocysteine lyase